MAEGGIGCHRDTSSPDTGTHSLDSRLLECPICLEHLRQPKSLPCLHCFCQDCLSAFITKEPSGKMSTSFSCPVCRRVTQPTNPSEKKENWATQFPTNSLIQELMQLKKLYCKPCGKKGTMESQAQFWCKSVNVLFCEVCKVCVHDIMHEQCDALVTAGADNFILPDTLAFVKCKKHQDKIDYYCEDHKTLGCSKCIIVDHRPCKIVTTTEEYCNTLKTSSRRANLLESLQTSADTIGILIRDFSEQLQTFVKQQDTGLKTIRELRKEIDQCLDKMEKELTDELITAVKREKDNVEMALRQCEQLQTSICKTLESSLSATLKNEYVETILLYQRGHTEVETCNNLVTEMRKTCTSVSVRHVIDPGQKIIGKHSRLYLGKIVVEKQPRQLPCGKEYLKPLSECGVKEIQMFCIKTPSDSQECEASGVVYLPDGYIAVGDYCNNKLKLYTDKGQYLDELKVEGYPYDLCMVDTNTVAVAVSRPGRIHVVNMKSSKPSLLYSIEGPGGKICYGVTHTNGRFFVSTGTQVYSMTSDGKSELLHTLPTNCYSLTYDPKHGHIYASQYTDKTGDTVVYRLSGDIQTDIMEVGVVNNAWGVDMDRESNVYVCGSWSHNVVQMSRDETNVRELLTSSIGVMNPQAISVRGDKIVVTTVRDPNYVKIYQLS